MKAMKALVLLMVVILVAAWLPMAAAADDETLPTVETTVPQEFSGSCGDNVSWHLEDGVLTISGSGDMTACPWQDTGEVIRKAVISDGITEICDFAFEMCDELTSVTIPNSVRGIGVFAFANCESLTHIDVPSSLEYIGAWAFEDSGISGTIKLPASLNRIGDAVFYGTGITRIIFTGDMPTISENAFTGLTAYVYYPPKNSTWDESKMSSYNNKIKWIASEGEYAGTVGPNAQWKLEGSTLTISGSGVMYDYHKAYTPWAPVRNEIKKLVISSGITHIGEDAFGSLEKLQEVSIPSTVKSIGIYAFAHCSSLTKVVIPNSVTTMELCAFADCPSLKSVVLPNKLSTLSSGLFFGCTGLQEITIPASVNYIEVEAFRDCPALKKITFLGDAPDFVYPFSRITATCYYPANNPTWTEEIMTAMGDCEETHITWVAYEPEPEETEPKPTEPKPTEPKPTTPKPTEPKATEPKATTPKTTEPGQTEPAVIPDETEPVGTTVPETTAEVTEPADATDAVQEPQDDTTDAVPEVTDAPQEDEPAGKGGIIAIVCLAVVVCAGGAAGFIYMKKRRG